MCWETFDTMASTLAYLIFFLFGTMVASGTSESTEPPPYVPAMLVFGDSSVDVGNNNYVADAMFKANYAPYGMDFGRTTGRFSDGKLVLDFTAEFMGFKDSPPPYLSPATVGRRLKYGANFASSGAGYWDRTSKKYNAISLTQQLGYFNDYRFKLARVTGKNTTANTLSEALYLLSVGNGDLMQNYFIDAELRKAYALDSFFSLIISDLTTFVKKLHGMGARRIGVTSLPPTGCLPATIHHYGKGNKGCVKKLNEDAKAFNKRQVEAINSLGKELPNLKIGVLNIYEPILELVTNPTMHGFLEASKGCCGTGTAGTTIRCKPKTSDLCSNASQYVFWDGVHPTEAANAYIAQSLVFDGIALLS